MTFPRKAKQIDISEDTTEPPLVLEIVQPMSMKEPASQLTWSSMYDPSQNL